MDHLHVIINARGLGNPPRDAETVERWLTELVAKVDMKVLIPARAVRCDTEGNEGVTGIVCIETSHASIHVWDGIPAPFLNMDLYSCKLFDPRVVVDHLAEFEPTELTAMAIDRTTSTVIASYEGTQ